MTLVNDSHYNEITALISDFADEIQIHTKIIDRMIESNDPFSPMCVFFSTPTTKEYLIVPPPQENFAETLSKISAAMHLYCPLQAYSVLVVLRSKMMLNDEVYESLNFFVCSELCGFVYYLPFTIDTTAPSKSIVWHEELAFIDVLTDAELDDNGRDFVSVLHSHIQVRNSAFTAADILCYLSRQGFAIQALNPNAIIPYIDMSTFEYTQTAAVAYP
jgi:hypothetical protein